jgi:succinoglycan biosynthesis protein ExoM
MTGSREISVDIAVCTYRRKHLAQTLMSLGLLVLPQGVSARIIIADNDTAPSARQVVDSVAGALPLAVEYVHCPASNISIARNACLDHATGDFVAFIDDDEMASEKWLSSLLAEAEKTGADVVLGPVRSIYSNAAPAWMRKGDFHSTLPVWVGGQIRTGYTCNVLLRRAARSIVGRRFDLALGKSGGEDTEFFDHVHQAGGRIAFAPEAVVYEPVPENRAELGWLVKRRFRFGQTHGRLVRQRTAGFKRLANIGLASAKSLYCFAAAGLLVFRPIPHYRYALRGIMHAGVVVGLAGVREIEQYGQLEPTA